MRITARIARALPWLAAAALFGWYVATSREGEVLGVPRLGLWASVMVAGGIGLFAVARWLTRAAVALPARLAIVAAAGAVTVAITFGVVHHLVPATALQAGVAAVLLGASLAVGALVGLREGWGFSPALLLAGQAIAMWLVIDVGRIQGSVHLREELHVFLFYDFKVYMAAGRNFLAGEPVYLDHVMTALPATTHSDPFLYPPVLLPVVAALASLPRDIVEPAFFLVLLTVGALAFRLIGVSWAWALLLLAYPPVFKGALSGNVANLTFALYAAAPFVGGLLLLGLLFKLHAAVPAVWLLRTRRWRDIMIGLVVLLLLVAVTLPFVGAERWSDYVVGLAYRERTQQVLPALYGQSLAQYMPLPLFAALSAVVVGLALVPGGRKSLAMLGIAAIVASPSLWPHGFIMAIPAALVLPASILWLVLGVAVSGRELWLLPLVGLAAYLIDWQRLRIGSDPVHPLGGSAGPWQGAEER